MKKRYIIIPFVIVLLLTLGFSSFGTRLFVDNMSVVIRAYKEVRVTNVANPTTYSSGVSKSYDYNVDNIHGTISLPNSNSTVTYEVDVTNIGNVEIGILSVVTTANGNSNVLEAVIDSNDYTVGTKICNNNACSGGITKTMRVTLKYKSGASVINGDINFITTFTFSEACTITYRAIEGNYPTEKLVGDSLVITLDSGIEADELTIFTSSGTLYMLNNQYTYSNNVLTISALEGDTTIWFNTNRWYKKCNSSSEDLKCKLIQAETPYADNVSSTRVSSSSGINFTNVAGNTNGLGLYYTGNLSKTNDLDGDGTGERVYYYRGLVTNNFVRFDSYCWRIVRINEDGSIRLIYAGTPSNNSCPQNGSSNVYTTSSAYHSATNYNTYVGYRYGSTNNSNYNQVHSNSTNSTIKGNVDNWYTSNLSDSSSYLADEIFCNDRSLSSGNGTNRNNTTYGPGGRFYSNSSSQSPTFKCEQDNDKYTVSGEIGNGALTNPIALLTADEASYAGIPYSTSTSTSNTSYLYSGNNWWTMSPSRFVSQSSGYQTTRYAYMFVVNSYGRMGNTATNTSNNYYIRPVINLAAGVSYSSGAGTYNNPYMVNGVVEEEEYDDPDLYYEWYRNCKSSSTKLNCTIIRVNNPSDDSSISFASASSSSNGNGMYYISDSAKTTDLNDDGVGDRVYYFRGAVTNNYVLLGNYCWRILRTNEDGTVRLIYGGTPTSGSCPQNGSAANIGSSAFNTNNNDNAYVGYMYGTARSNNYEDTHRNTNNSTIKTFVDNWYTTNFANNSDYLADEVFCNDRLVSSGVGYGGYNQSQVLYAGYSRISNNSKNPSLICAQANDRFTVSPDNGNGALTYPIGLITADELMYAGATYSTGSTAASHFLYVSNTSMWTMTPADDYTDGYFYVHYMATYGNMRLQNNVATSNTVRPVINIVSSAIITSGTGVYNSPYQLGLPEPE